MASVFKRSRDKGKRKSSWYISYSDESGKRKTRKGFTDKRATEDLAIEIERDVRRIKLGLVDPIVKKRKEASDASIDELLLLFEASISKNSPKHVSLLMGRLRRLVKDAEFKTIANIDVESVEVVLGEMLESNEIGFSTYNHYAQAIQQFCNWLVPRRLAVNPLNGMKRLNADVDVRHPRRALEREEIMLLISSARQSNVSIQCYSGEQRARIYTLSYMTGLRRKELASLTPASFKLTVDPPTLTVAAAFSKHRKKDVLPLHPELVAQLRDWLKGLPRDEPIFPKLAKRRTWLMVKKDLERVGIPYVTDEGIADFHAAGRHTHITELLRSGASLPEARELARHSDIRMTMKYTHIGIDDQAKAVSRLPWNQTPSPDHSTGDNSEAPEDFEEPRSDPNHEDESWQRYDSGAARLNGQLLSTGGTEITKTKRDEEAITPFEMEGYGESCPDVSKSGTSSALVEAAGIEPGNRQQPSCYRETSYDFREIGVST